MFCYPKTVQHPRKLLPKRYFIKIYHECIYHFSAKNRNNTTFLEVYWKSFKFSLVQVYANNYTFLKICCQYMK